jgi:hypothetical protein
MDYDRSEGRREGNERSQTVTAGPLIICLGLQVHGSGLPSTSRAEEQACAQRGQRGPQAVRSLGEDPQGHTGEGQTADAGDAADMEEERAGGA